MKVDPNRCFAVRRHPQFTPEQIFFVRAETETDARARIWVGLIQRGMDPTLPYLICRMSDPAPVDFWVKEPLPADPGYAV